MLAVGRDSGAEELRGDRVVGQLDDAVVAHRGVELARGVEDDGGGNAAEVADMQRAVIGEADKKTAAILGGGQAGAFALDRRLAALAVVGVERLAGDA